MTTTELTKIDRYNDLYEYQKEGVELIKDNRRFILADDMGLGKTVQTLMACRDEKSILIACPVTLIKVWQREIHKWLNESVQIITGTTTVRYKKLMNPKKWNIISHESLRQHDLIIEDLIDQKKYTYLVVDEAHKIRNKDTKLFKIIESMTDHVLLKVLLITGTPLVNRQEELYNLLSLVQMSIDDYFDWLSFHFYATIDYSTNRNTYKLRNKERFQDYISDYMLRRTKDEALDLPERNIIKVPVELEGLQKFQYKKAENDLYVMLGEFFLNEDDKLDSTKQVGLPNVLTQLMRLKQICVSTDIIDKDIDELNGAKIDMFLQMLDEIREQNPEEKVVFFSQFRTVVDRLQKILEKRGIRCSKITGELSSRERDRNIQDFKENKDVTVILSTIKAGGLGITLTEASTMFFSDYEWTPAANNQAIDRIHRIGQGKKCNIYMLLIPDTVEDKIFDILYTKQSLFDEAIPTHNLLRGLLPKNV